MRITKEEKKKREKGYEVPMTEESYPYGLLFSLDEMSIQKLGINDLPKVGKELMLIAKVEVTTVSNTESESGQNRRIGLQITELELNEKKNEKDTAETLYGDG